MATPEADAALARLYRQSQVTLRARTVRDVIRLWPTLRMDKLASYAAWLAAMKTLVDRDAQVSRSSTAGYLSAAWLAAGNTGLPDVPSISLPTAQVETSLRVTSLVAYRRGLGLGMTPTQASENALVQVSGATSRLVLDAGRQASLGTAKHYRAKWARVASTTACEFCKMLAGRGFVYSEDSVDFPAHDHCSCVPEIQFGRAAA